MGQKTEAAGGPPGQDGPQSGLIPGGRIQPPGLLRGSLREVRPVLRQGQGLLF